MRLPPSVAEARAKLPGLEKALQEIETCDLPEASKKLVSEAVVKRVAEIKAGFNRRY